MNFELHDKECAILYVYYIPDALTWKQCFIAATGQADFNQVHYILLDSLSSNNALFFIFYLYAKSHIKMSEQINQF